MAQFTEAVYTNGVFKPSGELSLREAQRVRLIVQPSMMTPLPATGPRFCSASGRASKG